MSLDYFASGQEPGSPDNASIVAAHEITIGADIQAVWDVLTQIDRLAGVEH